MVLPPVNFQAEKAGFVTIAFAPDYVKDLPFTGMAVFKPWANVHVEIVKRVLAATDASIAWFADPAHRSEAVDLLVQTAHATKEDAAASSMTCCAGSAISSLPAKSHVVSCRI